MRQLERLVILHYLLPLIAVANPYAMKTKKNSNQWLPVFSAHLMAFLSSIAKQQNMQNVPAIKNPAQNKIVSISVNGLLRRTNKQTAKESAPNSKNKILDTRASNLFLFE